MAIGKVTRIAVRPSENGKDNLITVEMVAIPSAVDPGSVAHSDSKDAKEEFFHEFFTREVKKGLRCRIDMAGITGIKYIEIDYFEKHGRPKIDFKPPEGNFYLPSTPSLFKELSKNISQALFKISSIDFKKISNEMETTLISVNRYLNDPKINKLLDRLGTISDNLEKTSKSINETLTKDKINQIIKQVQDSLRSMDELAGEVKKEIAAAKLEETTREMRTAMKTAVEMRGKISETLDSITELVDYLDNDPSSVIHGKQQPEFDFRKKSDTE